MCEEKKLPVITPGVENVLAGLQAADGPAHLYQLALGKMINKVVIYQGELEMSAQEAMSTLRTLWMLLEDVTTLARLRVTAVTCEPIDAEAEDDDDEDDKAQ